MEWKESWLWGQTGLDSNPISICHYSQLILGNLIKLWVCFLSCEMGTMIILTLRVLVRFSRVHSFIQQIFVKCVLGISSKALSILPAHGEFSATCTT